MVWRPDDDLDGLPELSQESERRFVERQAAGEFEACRIRRRESYLLRDVAGKLLKHRRVCDCGRKIVKGSHIEAYTSRDSGRAFYGNLKMCGSVWICSVCATKITEKRRKELKDSLTAWNRAGNFVFLLTLTIPHHASQSPKVWRKDLLKALKTLQNRTFWRTWKERIALEGTIRALEVTYGLNGAHVHIHCLLFCAAVGQRPAASDLLHYWQEACVSTGLARPNDHGVDICDGSNAAKYVTKWGLDYELTKSHIKRGKAESLTAFDLLRVYAGLHSADWLDQESAGELFRQHDEAFFRQRQLVWSKGLRAKLGLGKEKSDEQLAEEQTEHADLVAKIPLADWWRILRHNKRVKVLEIVEAYGAEGLKQFLDRLAKTDPQEMRCEWIN
jgi:hypothetical protein